MRRARSIRTKLLALLAVPLIALAVLAGLGVRWASDAAAQSRATARHMELSLVASGAALELSLERGLSAGTLAAPADEQVRRDLDFQRGQTDVAVDDVRSAVARVGGAGGRGPEAEAWASALGALDQLGDLRSAVDAGTVDIAGSLTRYSDLVDRLQAATGDLEAISDAELVTRTGAYDALTRATEEVALEQSLLMSVLSRGVFDPDTYDRLVGLTASQQVWLTEFERGATGAELAAYREAMEVPSVAAATRLRDEALAAGPSGLVTGDSRLWFTSMTRKVDLLESTADGMANGLATAADASRASAERRQVAFVGFGLAALGLIALLMVLLQRIIVRPIRRLTAAAHEVAAHALPHAVEVAQTGGPEAAHAATVALPVRSADEVGELTDAFNTVQRTAVALAAEQAALRRNVNEVFVNLGRRTQNLITRQLGHIDHLESVTEEPGALSDLFLLDHLATRLRRNAESLLVLAGAESPRPWTRPVSIVNVVRAAAAEATDYSRVALEHLGDTAVIGAAVNDVSHLLAELVDNALAFSPPTERVVVSGRAIDGGRYQLSVVDAGFGMSASRLAEANDRIANPPVADLAMSRFFGLFVVGRLAQRHGIRVTLAPSARTGVTAHVVLPSGLLVTPDGQGRPPGLAMGPPPGAGRAVAAVGAGAGPGPPSGSPGPSGPSGPPPPASTAGAAGAGAAAAAFLGGSTSHA
jgi:signal transduction histidine kinase